MKHKFSFLLIFLLGFPVLGQLQPKFNLEYVTSYHLDTVSKNNVMVVLVVTPIKKKDFQPIVSMKVGYKINNETQMEIIDIQKQVGTKIRISIYGRDIASKNPKIYNLIKDKVDLVNTPDIFFLAFDMRNISPIPIERMEFQYGLWEKRNQNIRIEKTFNFLIGE